MDITKGNFSARLPEMEAAIDSAIFLAIDGEFTGLNADKGNSAFDLPVERYSKVTSDHLTLLIYHEVPAQQLRNGVDVQVQESASQFLLVQFGLATFHYDPAKDQFSHRAFNVYVWPRYTFWNTHYFDLKSQMQALWKRCSRSQVPQPDLQH